MLPDFDEDYLILAVIAFMVAVWFGALWKDSTDFLSAAENIVTFGLGAVAGYLKRERKE
ncbi:hypothetical protein H6G45_09265 [Synechocystis sp. FACHB-383]|jgi:hypothetical protein|uniref:hypothetical protein n=1 Tax=Synechocystis sp. FACHB-383 TaxID=2692864 RepID=UPI001688648D|nr:hypothetical protein [Synechocystis sp. FACHB-383]MBD2653675.1 hypothetical protein [Synechocystis sp. FACHB-383]